MSRYISDSTKKSIVGRQHYQCANKPDSKIIGIDGYSCPLWLKNTSIKGNFDESGYEIDHIKEFSTGGSNTINNLQALCKCCHAVKTKRFNCKVIITNTC
jgi:5-methylcytosine-specific restriction endonuclease McrA